MISFEPSVEVGTQTNPTANCFLFIRKALILRFEEAAGYLSSGLPRAGSHPRRAVAHGQMPAKVPKSTS